jgi:PIN domain nuclease of toxin-antitoxin system
VAEPDAVVTDTHPLLFHYQGGARLGRRAARVFGAADRQLAIVYVPVVVIWECSLLSRIGRIDLGGSVESFFVDLFTNAAFQPLDLSPEQVYLADRIRPNDDPFDALICAAALSLELPLITRDAEIRASTITRTLW